MGMYPTNTPLDQWLTIWVFHEVESIVDALHPRLKFQYSGMSSEERRKHNLPTNRQDAISFIRKHRPNAGTSNDRS